MQDSVFTKIIKGEIPCHKVYEDNEVLVMADIHPIAPGHVLVIPKKQVEDFYDLDEATYNSTFAVTKRVAGRIKEVLNPKKVCVRIEGFDVPHVHVHVYPCNNSQEFYGDKDRMNKDPDHPALAAMAKKLELK